MKVFEDPACQDAVERFYQHDPATGIKHAKYLSKERPECLRRWRLWAGFGAGWEWTKVKDLKSGDVTAVALRPA